MFTKGQVVYSKCGRDCGRPFIVLDFDNEYVFIADGKLRLIDKPKKKKQRHVQMTHFIDLNIKEKIEKNQYLNDSDVRKSLEAYVNKENS